MLRNTGQESLHEPLSASIPPLHSAEIAPGFGFPPNKHWKWAESLHSRKRRNILGVEGNCWSFCRPKIVRTRRTSLRPALITEWFVLENRNPL